MGRKFYILILLILVFPGILYASEEKVKVALVNFENSSGNQDVDFLSQSLPLTLGDSLKKDNKYIIYKPNEFKKVIKVKGISQKDLVKAIQSNDVASLSKKISADAVIYGDYLYNIEDDSLKVNVKLYLKSQQSEVVFAVDGFLGFAIFNIIDRVKIILSTYLKDKKFITKPIKKSSRIGIVMNLTNREKNYVFMKFLDSGYNVKAFMANDFYYLYRSEMQPFDSLTSREMTSDTIPKADEKIFKTEFFVFSKDAEKSLMDRRRNYEAINKYTEGYKALKLNALREIRKSYDIDYLIFVNINHKKNTVNAKAIDLQDENIIWIQNDIHSDLKGSNPKKYTRLAEVLIQEMSEVKKIKLDFSDESEKRDPEQSKILKKNKQVEE